jgi:hypothetical protein
LDTALLRQVIDTLQTGPKEQECLDTTEIVTMKGEREEMREEKIEEREAIRMRRENTEEKEL